MSTMACREVFTRKRVWGTQGSGMGTYESENSEKACGKFGVGKIVWVVISTDGLSLCHLVGECDG